MTVYYFYNGREHTAREISEDLGVNVDTFRMMVRKRGFEEAIAYYTGPGRREPKTENAKQAERRKQSICWDCEKQDRGCIWARTLKIKPEGATFFCKTISHPYPIEICISCPEFVRKKSIPWRDE